MASPNFPLIVRKTAIPDILSFNIYTHSVGNNPRYSGEIVNKRKVVSAVGYKGAPRRAL